MRVECLKSVLFSTDDEVADRKGSGWGECERVFLDGGECDEEKRKMKKTMTAVGAGGE